MFFLIEYVDIQNKLEYVTPTHCRHKKSPQKEVLSHIQDLRKIPRSVLCDAKIR